MNTAPLHPRNAKRTAATFISDSAGKESLIPIYAFGGRSPGGTILQSPKLKDISNELAAVDDVSGNFTWWLETMIGDAIHNVITPSTTDQFLTGKPPTPEAGLVLDRVRQIGLTDEIRALSDALRPSLNSSNPYLQYVFRGLDPIVSTVFDGADTLAGFAGLPLYQLNPWTMTMNGQVNLRVPSLVCTVGGTVKYSLKIDFTDLLNALAAAFPTQTLAQIIESIRNKSLVEFLQTVLVASDALIDASYNWVKSTVQNLTTVPEQCKLPTLNPATWFNAGNITNWSLGAAELIFPAPQLEAMNQIVQDDQVDNDGLIHYSSQLGFRLGTTIDSFFNHTRLDHSVDLKPAPGSWYQCTLVHWMVTRIMSCSTNQCAE
jgi:hypothetical protein